MNIEYPKWLYHPEKEAIVVPDKEAHEALGHGWYDTPAKFPKPESAPAPDEAPKSRRHNSHGGAKA